MQSRNCTQEVMSRLILTILMASAQLALILSEWVEITKQKPTFIPPPNSTKSSIRILKKSDFLNLYGAIEMTSTTPSPQWIAYQRERFNVPNSQSSQQLIVSSGNHLKHSAHIMVPANKPKTNENTFAGLKRNQVVQTKTKIEVKNYIPEVDVEIAGQESTILQRPQVETTSRRDIHHTYAENVENLEVEEVEEESTIETSEELQENVEQQPPIGNANDNQNSPLKYPTVQGFIKFLKSIQKSLLSKSGFSIESKIKALKNLRDKLMRTIEEQFTMLWQPKMQRRTKRGLLDESSLNFPPEAALMSINFLTFAVFLIKLVLQVVHIVKSKHYTLTGLNMNNEVVAKTSMRN